MRHSRLYRRILVTAKERSFQDEELRRMLRASGLQLETLRVVRRLKRRPIRKLYVTVEREP